MTYKQEMLTFIQVVQFKNMQEKLILELKKTTLTLHNSLAEARMLRDL
jgi:hypothetical protein